MRQRPLPIGYSSWKAYEEASRKWEAERKEPTDDGGRLWPLTGYENECHRIGEYE